MIEHVDVPAAAPPHDDGQQQSAAQPAAESAAIVVTGEGATPEGGGEVIVADGTVVDRSDHPISRRNVPENVLKVLYRLHRSGYRAYLCGGSVRDLLMNRTPKDFDIATDAHPMEIRRLFRNSRIIGRRFRLVHVIFQDGFVEVSTFRREPERAEDAENLLVTDDNTFGTPLQDARRRDFTINGLFYNIADFSVIDYVGGLDDLNKKHIPVIGNPDGRFREDPVRMMRAIEFASRLGFEIEHETREGILRHRTEILKASPPRVSEEILELLRRGWSKGAIRLLVGSGLLEPLLPEISRAIGQMRIAEVILFIRDLIQPICARMALAAGTRHQIEQALETLWRLLEPPTDKRAQFRFVYREPFNDALALLELYALSSGKYVDIFRQWQAFAQKVKRSEGEAPSPPRRRKRKKG